MNERDELAEQRTLAGIIGPNQYSMDAAAAILAAGYRKPRTITTAEELGTLPENSVIRDSEPATLQLLDGGWKIPGSNVRWGSDSIDLPATVLYEPEPQP